MLLPQQPAPITRRDAALTARFLVPAAVNLMALFMDIRAETDAALGPALTGRYGKAYPLGCCREITLDVLDRLKARLVRPACPGARALRLFLTSGGTWRRIWGVLRGTYFQNALQFGGLYIDVSNDTVTVTKPKVEILPLDQSGIIAVRDLSHFADTARGYWKVALYANHALPSLAPLFPIISFSPKGAVGLQSATDYMVAMLRRDRFRQSRDWLEQAPPPPPQVVEALRAACPPDLRGTMPEPGRAAAVAACGTAASLASTAMQAWCNARLSDYGRVVQQGSAMFAH